MDPSRAVEAARRRLEQQLAREDRRRAELERLIAETRELLDDRDDGDAAFGAEVDDDPGVDGGA